MNYFLLLICLKGLKSGQLANLVLNASKHEEIFKIYSF